jgi:hypothetical protein
MVQKSQRHLADYPVSWGHQVGAKDPHQND